MPVTEAHREAARKYREANREKVREASRVWRKNNPEKQREASRRWDEANPEQKAAIYRRWAENHPEQLREKRRDDRRRRRAAKRGTTERVVESEILIRDRGHCGICGQPVLGDLHIDHIHPLSKGGPHSPENVQVAHAECNLRKGAKV